MSIVNAPSPPGCRLVLNDQSYAFQVKGLKKLENFLKREDDVRIWRARASPEEIEYQECQQELQQELLSSYMRVERVIGKPFKATSLDHALTA